MAAKRILSSGSNTCEADDLELVRTYVPDHIRLTMAEPGCVRFSIEASDEDPCKFIVSEEFIDRSAFDAHTARTRQSAWWEKTQHIPRDITVTEA